MDELQLGKPENSVPPWRETWTNIALLSFSLFLKQLTWMQAKKNQPH